MMTDHDNRLVTLAKQTKFSDYMCVQYMIAFADTDECKETLRTIRNMLFDIYTRQI